jgi:hypothetical protein
LSLAVASAIAGCAPQAAPARQAPAFGVLGSSCAPDRLAQLRAAGVSVVELPLAWDRYEPARGQVDESYVAQSRARLAACRAAGLRVVLSPGLQYPPAWVRDLPGAVLLGSAGGRPRGVDLVFSTAVRDATNEYLGRLATDVGFDGVAAVRVGTTTTGELGYPGPGAGGHAGEYWAFSAPAVHGSPLPGWAPGRRTVTAAQAETWFTWYTGALTTALGEQIDRLRQLGFTGRVHLPVAGRGVLPADRTAAVEGLLDGRNDPDGALERGLDYPAIFAALAARDDADRIDIDFTGLDDVSAVRARALHPAQDGCRAGDESRADVADWSGQRFIAALARRHGLGLVGENPGAPDAPHTGGAADSDPLAEQLVRAPAYAAGCGMTTFLFAFEDDLFDGTDPDLDDYAGRIAAAEGRG